MSEKVQKILSSFGYGSRRYIEKMILSKNILINGKRVIIGQRISIKDIIEIKINGEILPLKTKKTQSRIIVYHKPEGEICTRIDFKQRKTVFDKLPILNMNRWISVGRLDINTQGLLLFTNNGDLANQLMHPRNKIEREYYMRVFGEINKNTMNILKNGVKIKDHYASFQKITPLFHKKSSKNQWFKGILCEGKNREIRYMWEKVKCKVSRLIRVRYGNIILPKKLQKGCWLELNSLSIESLYNLISINSLKN